MLLASEPTKIACVRNRIPIAPALTALAIENVFYTLSVGAMIAGGIIGDTPGTIFIIAGAGMALFGLYHYLE